MRPIQATIHLDALRHNLAVAKHRAPNSKVMAVVKANAYGHGLLRAAEGLSQADGFAVLELNEAISLREAGYLQTILLLEGLFDRTELVDAAKYDISIVVHCEQQIEMLEQVNLSTSTHVFLKMNTGMNRLGFIPETYASALTRLEKIKSVADITMMTHFATADEDAGIVAPLARFKEVTKGFDYPTSLANSAALLRYPASHSDWVRPGILMYGASPVSGQSAHALGLQPAMTFTSELIAVQVLQDGESVGYGQKFTAHKTTRVGVVACGYADGYPRHTPSGTAIAVDGQLTRTLGRVSMDMLFADITDIPDAAIGSQVELWGAQVPVDVIAEASGTVGYELLCAVAPRVPFKVIG
ncbi:alanine racemase [Methylovorus sp. MM2]|uniref:alanine racemase n=1 Tax=Methylovorus sp. MM2 TaxID=1848038 RepID=UPI0007E1DA73|nr:alanine racemase [Methylovorus sp. MM2]OAM52966.1 alanine racemase [Methylovorus sp. MM2]